ncbi:MAG: hypothetical protein LBO63_03345 [Oscillospiraceae bacterium]|jgi:hypothetical protein|nr:hypothetical protein [Oscillospiraceae bacterium]
MAYPRRGKPEIRAESRRFFALREAADCSPARLGGVAFCVLGGTVLFFGVLYDRAGCAVFVKVRQRVGGELPAFSNRVSRPST